MMHLVLDQIPTFDDPNRPVMVTAHITNTTADHVTLSQATAGSMVIEGNIRAGKLSITPTGAQDASITLAPGDTWSPLVQAKIELDRFEGSNGKLIADATFNLSLYPPSDLMEHDETGTRHYRTSATTQIELNFDALEWLRLPDGSSTRFYRTSEGVFANGGPTGTSTFKIADPSAVRALTHSLAHDADHIYQFYGSKKKRPSGGIESLSRVFYRVGEAIWTSYGNAKIDDPATFEVLDNGVRTISDDEAVTALLSSYGRDASTGYFFKAMSSTNKASKMRACKSPQTLVSLGRGYAKDENSVFLESTVIKGADPISFERINPYYWRDAKGIGYQDSRVPDADPATFEPVDYFRRGRLSKPAVFSNRGQDKNHQFVCGRILQPGEDDD